MTRKVLFYVQHLLGVGHLARASLIAKALLEAGFEVTLATGGPPVAGFPDAGLETFALPAVRSAEGFSGLLDQGGQPIDETFRERRRELLVGLFGRRKPDVLLIEAYPFGRRQMRFELIPLLERAREAPWRPLVASSVRDILQEARKPGRVAEAVEALERFFDLVLVHGDPDFVPLDDTFPATDEIRPLLRYTGIVAGPVPRLDGDRHDIVVSAGGGAAGQAIMRAARDALERLSRPDLTWCFLTGPNFPAALVGELFGSLPPNAAVETYRTDFRALLARAKLSISQCGYNTAADVLQAGCRAVFVPFAAGDETEQTRRARALEERGVATVVEEDRLAGEELAKAIEQALASDVGPAWTPKLDGARRTAEILLEALAVARVYGQRNPG